MEEFNKGLMEVVVLIKKYFSIKRNFSELRHGCVPFGFCFVILMLIKY